MPTISQLNIPSPKSWDEFEDIVLDALKSRWSTSEIYKNGRQGQTQNGVDIFGSDDLSQAIGVQCKNYNSNIHIKNIKEEIKKAENFEPKLLRFYIATSMLRDAKLQKEIRLLSKERVDNNQFAVGIFFWEDIIQDLIANKESFNKHYPQFHIENKQEIYPTLIGLLDLVFYGKSLIFYMDLIFGEFSPEPLEIQAICDLIDNGSIYVKNEKSRSSLITSINKFRSKIEAIIKGEVKSINLTPIRYEARKIELATSSIESLLDKEELLVYKIGDILSNWDRNVSSDILIEKASIVKFIKLLDKLNLDREYVRKIKKLIDNNLNSINDLSSVQVPSWIYNLVRQGLIEMNLL